MAILFIHITLDFDRVIGCIGDAQIHKLGNAGTWRTGLQQFRLIHCPMVDRHASQCRKFAVNALDITIIIW